MKKQPKPTKPKQPAPKPFSNREVAYEQGAQAMQQAQQQARERPAGWPHK